MGREEGRQGMERGDGIEKCGAATWTAMLFNDWETRDGETRDGETRDGETRDGETGRMAEEGCWEKRRSGHVQ